jgi:hypothetical protein
VRLAGIREARAFLRAIAARPPAAATPPEPEPEADDEQTLPRGGDEAALDPGGP